MMEVSPIRPFTSPAVTATEFIYTPCRIDDPLFTRIKWMTGRADFHMQLLAQGGASLEAVSTAAVNGQGGVFGVNIRLHGDYLKQG
jgi:hypothetical protein